MSRVRDAGVEAVLAGAIVGLYEGARLAYVSGLVSVGPIATAVATLGAIGAALVLGACLALIARAPMLRVLTADLASRGSRRVLAAWRAALVAIALATFGFGAFWLFELMHERFRFNDAGPIGLVYVCAIVVFAAVIVWTALAIERSVRPRLPDGAFDGRRAWILAALAAVLVLVMPALVVARAIPALTLDYIVTPSVLVAAALAMRAVHAGRYRAARVAAITVVAAAAAGTWALAGSPSTRGAIVAHGVASSPVARALRVLGDRDGDGYAGAAVGGADCDDGDARRHPAARDVADNGADENCTGADAKAATFGLRTQTRPVPPVQSRPNIVLISIDALRADHLGSYGYARRTSPGLDALAASGVRFASAFTSCPSTRCAIPALHTGRYASTLGSSAERETIPSLARLLRDAGWTTAAITCCERFARARYELSGFTTMNASADAVRMRRAGQSNADVVIDYTLEWLRGIDRSRPYFAWLHLYEPHFPYEAPGGSEFGGADVDRYDAEIAFVDAQIARLVAELDPTTIVVVTSDHGEEFNEHGQRFHARSLYNQVIRIPLIMRVPGVAPRVVDTPVSLVDVTPTLLDLCGVEGPTGMNGRTLVPALRGGAAPVRPIFIELIPDHQIERDMAAVVNAPWKVLWDRAANAWSVYRLDDVDDEHDLAEHPVLPELQRVLAETIDRETGVR